MELIAKKPGGLAAGFMTALALHRRTWLAVGSFLLPLMVWSLVSYVPYVWHPKVLVTDPGGVDHFQVDMLVDKAMFAEETANMRAAGLALPNGHPANPIYLPAPHEVAEALVTAWTKPPETTDTPSMPASLWHSIQIIFWGFLISSLIGVPLGILSGTYATMGRLNEPFIEFFR